VRICIAYVTYLSVLIYVGGIFSITMSSLTNKLFDKLIEQEKSIEVDELLKYFKNRDSAEYQQVVDANQTPVDRTKKLKALVLKSFHDNTLKDLQFFKYLAWSGQGDLCKMIGYNDKQIAKWMRDKPTNPGGKPQLITAGNDTEQDMETDQGVCVCLCACVFANACTCASNISLCFAFWSFVCA